MDQDLKRKFIVVGNPKVEARKGELGFILPNDFMLITQDVWTLIETTDVSNPRQLLFFAKEHKQEVAIMLGWPEPVVAEACLRLNRMLRK